MFINTQLYINGTWRDGAAGRMIDVVNPAHGGGIGAVAHAEISDLDDALAAADAGFRLWRATSALERSGMLRNAASNLRDRLDHIASQLTMEQGKPVAEAKAEILGSAEIFEWLAEEARRSYGRIIPARIAGVTQMVTKEPVGPVAAFTPWNFPMSQVARKIGAALAAGCSIICKAAEETPATAAELVKALADAGLPAGVVNLVYGTPAMISEHLIAHPVIRKISFTGSVPVGKHLAALAGAHMKRATMELGGHAPAVVFDDVDIEQVSTLLVGSKYRNAGQVCVSPTRFLVHESVVENFVDRFSAKAGALTVGDGLDSKTRMGPLINENRRLAVEALIQDATDAGARCVTGGRRVHNRGFFLEPTVLNGVTRDMRIMNEEPFGPVALVTPFHDMDDVLAEANRLPFGLAAYAFSRSARNVAVLAEGIETGMLSVNHLGLALAETPFGGVKDSGYGSEGGTEAIEAYLVTKFVTNASHV